MYGSREFPHHSLTGTTSVSSSYLYRGLVFGKVGPRTVKRCCKPAKFPVSRPKDVVRRIPLPLVAMHRLSKQHGTL